ncbi:unnamed protein product [Paramecium sonneborni]|uniref:Transmembrane protein n=1 Tax=Paramecium sonneborni TaxID=65129 RepID=A0A8S1R561_9CILI|nr:unnamed protein product [Paramecium sonneborni]
MYFLSQKHCKSNIILHSQFGFHLFIQFVIDTWNYKIQSILKMINCDIIALEYYRIDSQDGTFLIVPNYHSINNDENLGFLYKYQRYMYKEMQDFLKLSLTFKQQKGSLIKINEQLKNQQELYGINFSEIPLKEIIFILIVNADFIFWVYLIEYIKFQFFIINQIIKIIKLYNKIQISLLVINILILLLKKNLILFYLFINYGLERNDSCSWKFNNYIIYLKQEQQNKNGQEYKQYYQRVKT